MAGKVLIFACHNFRFDVFSFIMTSVIHYAIMSLIYGIALYLLIWGSIGTGKDYIDCSLCEIKTDYIRRQLNEQYYSNQ